MVTVPDFSVPHTQFWCLWKEDHLGFTFHHPELIMLKNVKSYRLLKSYRLIVASALKNIVPHWFFFYFIKKYMKSVLEQSRKIMDWKSHVSWDYISNLKKIPWKIWFLQPFFWDFSSPPPVWGNIFTKCIEEFYKLFSHYTYNCIVFNYKTVDIILDMV